MTRPTGNPRGRPRGRTHTEKVAVYLTPNQRARLLRLARSHDPALSASALMALLLDRAPDPTEDS